MSEIDLEVDKVDLAILALLRKNPRGISAGALTLKVGIPIRAVVKSFRKLRRFKFARESGSVLHLTRTGRQWINNNQSMFAFSGEKPWREVPSDFKQPQLRPFKPYAPLRSKVSKKILRVEG